MAGGLSSALNRHFLKPVFISVDFYIKCTIMDIARGKEGSKDIKEKK